MATELSGSAALDRRHDFQLPEAQVAAVSRPVLRASRTEDVGDLKMRSTHARSAAQPLEATSLTLLAERQAIERALDLEQRFAGDVRVSCRCFQLLMAQKDLDHAHVGLLL